MKLLENGPAARIAAGVLVAILGGCATVRTPGPSPVPCSRVDLDPAPPWTASAAWNASETEMLLVDPGSGSLATYGRHGRRLREVPLGELDFSAPMRLERVEGGYVLIDKSRMLTFDESLAVSERGEPFGALADRGIGEGSFNDVLFDGEAFYGYVDFVDSRRQPAGGSGAEGSWRRGFVRLAPRQGSLVFLHELDLDEGGEYAAYYVYDRRPYVTELDGKVYVLRFSEPWSVHRARRRSLESVASGRATGEVARALHGWNGRLYVLTSRRVPAEDDGEEEPSRPVLQNVDPRVRAELLQALPAAALGRHDWTLHEIHPRTGARREIPLPSAAEKLRLVPGRTFWTAVEETAAPNLGQGDGRTSFLFLPASELLAASFSCAAPSPEKE